MGHPFGTDKRWVAEIELPIQFRGRHVTAESDSDVLVSFRRALLA
jgi:hypothetical protein